MRPAAALLALCLCLIGFSAALAQDRLDLASPQMLDGRHLIVTVDILEEADATARLAELTSRHPVTAVTLWPLRAIALHCLVVRVSDDAPVAETLAQIEAEADVRWVQPVNGFALSADYADEHFARQHALAAMNVARAHDVATGAAVRVALIDTGVDTTHPDLADRVSVERDFVNDGKGNAEEDHGTAMAGVLAADARNGAGIVGVAPDADILSFRACWEADRRGLCTTFSLARALNVAIMEGVSIINLSLGGPDDPLVRTLIERAITNGITVVSAAGGHGFPASVAGVIAAAGEGRMAVPAEDILTTLPGGRYGFRSGSSIAAAHVSGLAALLKQAEPAAAPAAIGAVLLGAKGEGVIDACRALATLRPVEAQSC